DLGVMPGEDCRSPRRFATVGSLNSPPGFGVRQSSGALETGVGSTAGEALSSASLRSSVKAVEDYRSPRRFATAKVAGKSARFWSGLAERSGDGAFGGVRMSVDE